MRRFIQQDKQQAPEGEVVVYRLTEQASACWCYCAACSWQRVPALARPPACAATAAACHNPTPASQAMGPDGEVSEADVGAFIEAQFAGGGGEGAE